MFFWMDAVVLQDRSIAFSGGSFQGACGNCDGWSRSVGADRFSLGNGISRTVGSMSREMAVVGRRNARNLLRRICTCLLKFALAGMQRIVPHLSLEDNQARDVWQMFRCDSGRCPGSYGVDGSSRLVTRGMMDFASVVCLPWRFRNISD